LALGSDSVTLYLPSSNWTEVLDELPSKEDGVGLLPSTVIVKSDGSASPPPSLITCLVTNNIPMRDTLLESPFDGGTEEDWDDDD
jgi:hypothetical protein